MNFARILLFLLLLALLVGCETQQNNSSPLVWRDGQEPQPGATPDSRESTAPAPSSNGERVEISVDKEVMKELMEFINREQYIMADRIEVDASRIPFQIAMVPVADPAYVTKEVLDLKAQRAIGILLKSRLEKPFLERDFPRLRVGDGIDLVASRQIQVRSHIHVTKSKPIFLVIRGLGHAVYSDTESGTRMERESITLMTEVVPSGDGYRVKRRIF